MTLTPSAPVNTRPFSVLCIDDEPSNLEIRKMLLESVGISPLTANSGQEGLDVFAANSVDAVIIDYSMPDMDGGEMAARLKQQKPEIPVIMLTAYPGAQEIVADVVDAFVEKGGDPTKLLARVQSLLKIRSHSHPEVDGGCLAFFDSSRQFLDCTDEACQLLGYSRAELLDTTIDTLSYQKEIAAQQFQQLRERGRIETDNIFRHKTGRPVFVRSSAWAFPDGCIVASWTPVNDWKELYRAAMLELDRAKLKSRIEVALLAVHQRLRELGAAAPSNGTEKIALNDALNGLRVLQRE